jgi:hypothetical protein
MAAFTISRDRRVGRCGRLAGQAVRTAQMASGTLRGNRYISMEGTREPAGVARLVATIAVGYSDAPQSRIRNVVDRFSIRRRVCTAMASGALVGYRHLCVVPLGGSPCRSTVAAHAIHGGRHVRARLARGRTAVVAAGTIGSRSKQAVIDLGAQPGAGRFMATLANRLAIVNSGRRPTRCPIAGAHVACRALRGNRHVGVELSRVPAGRTVAAHTVHAGGNMRRCFARSRTAVMATGAIGNCREQTVVRLGAQPRAG